MFKTIRNLINLINYPSNWRDVIIVEHLETNVAGYETYRAKLDKGFINVGVPPFDNFSKMIKVGDKVKVQLSQSVGSHSRIVWVKDSKK